MSYKFYYRNTKTGANIMSHAELDRPDLELKKRVQVGAVKNTQMKSTAAVTKPVVTKDEAADEVVEEAKEEATPKKSKKTK